VSENNGRPARDIVLIGGSAGAIEALTRIVSGLPAEFPASILVVVHTSPESPSMLPQILARAGKLPAVHPEDGTRIRPGHIYVAPPDHHISLAADNVVRVRKGPRENGHRPAIDPLFRSAAVHGYAARSIAVVLSGYLDDGSAGLYAIRRRGGASIVQDPADAIAGDLPSNAMKYAGTDELLPASAIAEKLVKLVGRGQKVIPMKQVKKGRANRGAAGSTGDPAEVLANELVSYPEEGNGSPSVFACPECHGVLWKIQDGMAVRYRCRVGHAYSEATLNDELCRSAESAMWAAMRALDEKAAMSRRMADAAHGPQRWATRMREQADTYASHAEVLRKMILGELPPAEEKSETKREA
jgi:two-component system, chemotaxis family, protein-glutamate methylesterase/glutaminase